MSSVEYTYLTWASTAPRRAREASKPRTIAAARVTPEALRLASQLDLSDEAAAWLVATTLMLPYTHPGMFKSGPFQEGGGRPLVYVWASMAPLSSDESPRLSINENRFQRWLTARTWEEFLQETFTALRVIHGAPFRVLDLFDIARERAAALARDAECIQPGLERWDQWPLAWATMFHTHRPPHGGRQPPLTTKEPTDG